MVEVTWRYCQVGVDGNLVAGTEAGARKNSVRMFHAAGNVSECLWRIPVEH